MSQQVFQSQLRSKQHTFLTGGIQMLSIIHVEIPISPDLSHATHITLYYVNHFSAWQRFGRKMTGHAPHALQQISVDLSCLAMKT